MLLGEKTSVAQSMLCSSSAEQHSKSTGSCKSNVELIRFFRQRKVKLRAHESVPEMAYHHASEVGWISMPNLNRSLMTHIFKRQIASNPLTHTMNTYYKVKKRSRVPVVPQKQKQNKTKNQTYITERRS